MIHFCLAPEGISIFEESFQGMACPDSVYSSKDPRMASLTRSIASSSVRPQLPVPGRFRTRAEKESASSLVSKMWNLYAFDARQSFLAMLRVIASFCQVNSIVDI